MIFLSQVYAEFIKKLKLWIRRPVWAIVGIFGPLGISTLLIACFATLAELPIWTIGLIDEDNSTESRLLQQAITAHEGTIPYYIVTTSDPAEARDRFSRAELYMVVTIPKGFGNAIKSGHPIPVKADIVNAHADQTKNLRLGLDARLYLFYEKYLLPGSGKPGVIYTYSALYPVEIPRSQYMSAGALMLTVILASMIYAGLFSALEHEEKTYKEISMTPHGATASMIGTIAATIVEVIAVLAVVAAVNIPLWHLKIPSIIDLPCIFASILLLSITFAIIGYGLGNRAKDVRLVIGPTMLTILAFWILSGGITPVEAVAGAEFYSVLPTTATLRIMAKAFAGLQNVSMSGNLLIILVWAIAIIAIAIILKLVSNKRCPVAHLVSDEQ
jgi:hypothetical protein